jgi:hypothetical protein
MTVDRRQIWSTLHVLYLYGFGTGIKTIRQKNLINTTLHLNSALKSSYNGHLTWRRGRNNCNLPRMEE